MARQNGNDGKDKPADEIKTKHYVQAAKGPGYRMTPEERCEVLVLRHMGFTYPQIADKIGCSSEAANRTVNQWAKKNPDVVGTALAEAKDRMALELLKKGKLAIDYITPDSLTHDRIEVKDEDGNLIAVHHSGPTALQNATAAGILLDKANALRADAIDLRSGGDGTGYSPDSIRELVKSLGGRVERIKKLQIEYETDEVDQLLKAVEAEFEDITDAEGEDS
jgi:hypothetical protein